MTSEECNGKRDPRSMDSPFVIGIGGAHSGAGKTSLAEALLRRFSKHGWTGTGWSLRALKRWGALKYTKTAILTSVVSDADALRIQDKDTWRLLKAGAEQVVWLQAPPEDLEGSLPLALNRLWHLEGVIIEGNSAIEFAKPDVILFIDTADPEKVKPSGRALKAKADIIIRCDGEECVCAAVTGPPVRTCRFSLPFVTSVRPDGVAHGIDDMVDMMDDRIREMRLDRLLAERSREGRISCKEARKIAEETGVAYGEVGRAANRLRIKIRSCELGCF